MKKNKIKLLCTAQVGEPLVTEAGQLGIAITVLPLIKTVAVQSKKLAKIIHDLSGHSLVAVFSSIHAVESVRSCLADAQVSWKIFCTGSATRRSVEALFGEAAVAGTGNSAEELSGRIVSDASIRKVYFFCGDQRREELPAGLAARGIEVEEIMVYNTVPVAAEVLPQYDGIIFFSPSAVNSFFSASRSKEKTIFFSIGKTTANAIRAYTELPVIIAPSPDKEGLLRLAMEYFQKHPVQR
jgi:uroporphyrinogen-III synthase